MKWLLALLLVGLAGFVVATGCSGPVAYGAIKRLMYEEPWRDRSQQPERVVAALALSPGDRVADLGSGGGYFTFPIAEVVGESGRVFAVDVDDDLLAYVAYQADKRGLSQIQPVRAPEHGPGLPDASVDLIFLCNVYHHLAEPEKYFAGVRSVLRPGGRIAVVEASDGGFPKGHGTPPKEIQSQFEAAGYILAERHSFLERQSFQVFVLSAELAEN